MANKLIIVLVSVFACIGLCQGNAIDFNGEEWLVEMLFGEKPIPEHGVWTHVNLWKLKEIYDAKKESDGKWFGGMSKAQKERSAIVDQMCEFGDIQAEKCNDEYLKKLQETIVYMADHKMPNLRVFLKYYLMEQLELCLINNKDFKFTKVDSPLVWDDGKNIWRNGLNWFYNPESSQE